MRPRALTGLLLLLAATPALAQGDGNALLNPGAEEAAEQTDPEVPSPPPHWTANGPFTIVDYGTPDFPDAAESSAVSGGARFFSGGPGGFSSSASQQADLSANAEGIDAGRVRVELAAHLGGVGSDPDTGTVTAQFVAEDGGLMRDESLQVRQIRIGPVSPADRGNATRLVRRTASAAVPAGARAVRVLMQADAKDEGDYINAFFDNVTLRFPGAEQPVGAQVPDAGGGSGGERGGGQGVLPEAAPPAALGPPALRMSRSGAIRVRVYCTDTHACTGRLVAAVARPRRACGAARASVAAGRRKVVALKLSRVCRRTVAGSARGTGVALELRLRTGLVVRRTVTVRRG